MNILAASLVPAIIFWIALVLGAIGLFAPAPWPRVTLFAVFVCLVLLGLQVFYLPLR